MALTEEDDPDAECEEREGGTADAPPAADGAIPGTITQGGPRRVWDECERPSSSSMPSVMARMLEALAVRDGDRVLEIGTGSGYNAALLCERLGSENVTTIDCNAELVGAARQRLAEHGYEPTVVAGDGFFGYAPNALVSP